MFRSVFSKYFAVVVFIVMVTFTVLGAVQTVLSANFWMEEKQKLISENAERVAVVAAESSHLSADGSQYVLDMERSNLTVISELLCSAIDAHMCLTDVRGVLLCATPQNEITHVGSVPLSFMNGLSETETYFGISTVGGVYSERQYTAAAPIRKGPDLIGYVFATSPASNLRNFLWSNVRSYVLTMLGVMSVALLLTYWFTARLVRPLRNMSEAARRFGTGDFSYRIPVKGHDEVAQLATALNAMAISLTSSEDASRSFVANVSHELRTPMTTIGGFIDGILDGTIPKEKEAYYLEIVSHEVKRLSRLVRSMLDLSRIDNGSLKLARQEFDLTELCCHTLFSFEQRIEAKRLQITDLEHCESCPVEADPDLIGQVLYNLIDNAVKFTNEGGRVSIRTTQEPEGVRFTIRNSGTGVARAEMPHIFERFYKSDKSRGLDKTGAGLGLFLVKNIIELHGGTILVRSVEGEYSEFQFFLGKNIYQMDEKSSKKGHN